ncbi:hypothetical protein BGC30_04370 [Novacetimonas hansenii]|nr:hypothetical protein BGC30_04370 [Novacetimonas hansenii]
MGHKKLLGAIFFSKRRRLLKIFGKIFTKNLILFKDIVNPDFLNSPYIRIFQKLSLFQQVTVPQYFQPSLMVWTLSHRFA